MSKENHTLVIIDYFQRQANAEKNGGLVVAAPCVNLMTLSPQRK